MKKWEYNYLLFQQDLEKVMDQIEGFGLEGWELASTHTMDDVHGHQFCFAIFKREIPEGERKNE